MINILTICWYLAINNEFTINNIKFIKPVTDKRCLSGFITKKIAVYDLSKNNVEMQAYGNAMISHYWQSLYKAIPYICKAITISTSFLIFTLLLRIK